MMDGYKMIAYGAVLRLNLPFGKWLYTNMFINSCTEVTYCRAHVYQK